ncbi:MAG: TIGR04255 family protein [Minwuia sp.]|uniref:TIGR04255 family protein n=1 Tax=Minwuia sp. TaxID=2493630 RepID=UPI003A875400
MPNPTDFLYKRAPLVEVIYELHWELKAVKVAPDARIDNYFELFAEQFIDWAKKEGFERVDRLIPEDVPLELVPSRPLFRLRKSPDTWPLYQIGPGIFTANIIPPYNGWNDFKAFIKQGISGVVQSYPVSEKTLRFSKAHCRYLDAFDLSFGYQGDVFEYISNNLNLGLHLPQFVQDTHAVQAKGAQIAFDVRVPIDDPTDSFGFIRVRSGKNKSDDAVVVELFCETNGHKYLSNIESILEWNDMAHQVLRNWFDGLISDDLRSKMLPKLPIKSPEGN